MSTASMGLPSLTISFQRAAQETANRSKRGYVGVFVRDSKSPGVHQLSSAADIPGDLSADNQAYLRRTFVGSDRGAPQKVVAVVIGTDSADTDELEGGLSLIESMTLDYIAPPPDVTAAEKTTLELWIKNRRAEYFTEKLVEPNPASDPDHMGIISFTETDDALAAGSDTYTAGEYASRIAGILAGIPSGMSCTYAALPELTAVTARSKSEQDTAIKDGKLILIHDGLVAKIARGVNSLKTVPDGGNEDWRKIKIVEGMDLITYYLRTTIQGDYLGRYPNTYDNKCLLVTAIHDYLKYLETVGILSAGESWAEIDVDAQSRWLKGQGVNTSELTERQIKEYQTGSFVFVKCGGRLVDAMEDFQVEFSALATLAA